MGDRCFSLEPKAGAAPSKNRLYQIRYRPFARRRPRAETVPRRLGAAEPEVPSVGREPQSRTAPVDRDGMSGNADGLRGQLELRIDGAPATRVGIETEPAVFRKLHVK